MRVVGKFYLDILLQWEGYRPGTLNAGLQALVDNDPNILLKLHCLQHLGPHIILQFPVVEVQVEDVALPCGTPEST